MIINGLYVPKADGFWTQDEMIFIQWLKTGDKRYLKLLPKKVKLR